MPVAPTPEHFCFHKHNDTIIITQEINMTYRELCNAIAVRTGDDLKTIERLGFELHVSTFEPDRKEQKRLRRLRLWRQERRRRHLANAAAKFVQS